MLNKLFIQDQKNLFDDIVKYIDKMIAEYQSTVVQTVFESLNLENGQYSVKTTLPDMHYNVSVEKILNQIGKRSMGQRNISSFLGYEFEAFMEKALAPEELSRAVSAEAAQIVSSLAGGFSRTGGITSTSAVVKGQRDIRPDLGLGMSFTGDSLGTLNMGEKTISVELQELVDLNDLAMEEKEITSSEVLKSYIDANAFGFSLKLWKDGNNKEFSSSSVLQKSINNQFITYGPYGNRTTWESNYAEWFVVYQLSKYLINIISPTNVAMITGNNFIWMDDYISNKIFFMDVQLEALAKSKRGTGYEGFPSVMSSAIRIRQLNNTAQIFNTRVAKKTGKISIVNRRIT